MSLLEQIMRDPISVLHITETAAFKEGPDTFNLYRLALERGPDLSTDALMQVLDSKGLRDLQRKCARLLAGDRPTATAQTMRTMGDPFLASYEWATIRMRALKKNGATCQCCGKTAKDGVSINVDHVKPRRDFPELALDADNLQILCGDCNKGKGNWDRTDWRDTAHQPAEG